MILHSICSTVLKGHPSHKLILKRLNPCLGIQQQIVLLINGPVYETKDEEYRQYHMITFQPEWILNVQSLRTPERFSAISYMLQEVAIFFKVSLDIQVFPSVPTLKKIKLYSCVY